MELAMACLMVAVKFDEPRIREGARDGYAGVKGVGLFLHTVVNRGGRETNGRDSLFRTEQRVLGWLGWQVGFAPRVCQYVELLLDLGELSSAAAESGGGASIAPSPLDTKLDLPDPAGIRKKEQRLLAQFFGDFFVVRCYQFLFSKWLDRHFFTWRLVFESKPTPFKNRSKRPIESKALHNQP